MLPARMRSAAGWSDACILNLSSRGLLVFSKGKAEPGSFVEIRRGGQLVVARVVWRENKRIGLCSADEVPVENIISSQTAESVALATVSDVRAERRRVPRDDNRSRARAMEFMAILLVGTALAGAAAVSVAKSFAKPLADVDAALQRQ